MNCNNCGNTLYVEAKFCNKCGAVQFRQDEPEPTPLPEPPPAPAPAEIVPPAPASPAPQFVAPDLQPYSPPAAPDTLIPASPKKKSAAGLIAVIVAILVLGGGGYAAWHFDLFGGGTASDIGGREPTDTSDSPATSGTSDVVPPAPELTPAQVFANNRDGIFQVYMYRNNRQVGYGSGFVVCPSGIAVTNHHVMVNMTRAEAVFQDADGTFRRYDITGFYSYDIENDLAVIQIETRGAEFHALTIGDSDSVLVGNRVHAAGGSDGDPITFTSGEVSRIAHEPIGIGGGVISYTIAGMFQFTAPIYGGNSGGPLLDERGHAIGVSAAGSLTRASVGFAVPINRVTLPERGATLHPLPVGVTPPVNPQNPPPQPPPSGFLERYPFIPDFLGISRNSELQLFGSPGDLGMRRGDILYDFFDTLYIYHLPQDTWIADTEDFDDSLLENGFRWEDGVIHDGEFWMFFFHAGRNVSLSYSYDTVSGRFLVAIGDGNVYFRFFGPDGAPGGARNPDTTPGQPTSPEQQIVGTWATPGGGDRWYHRMTFHGNGRFIDNDGDWGNWRLNGNRITFDFDMSDSITFFYALSGSILTFSDNDGNSVQLWRQS
jgi:S1-C subfamily serine protease